MKSHTKYLIRSFIIVVLLLMLSGCEFVLGPKMTPDSNPEDLWVSSEPDISFVGLDEERGGATGRLVKDGEIVEIVMVWGYGSHFEIWRDPMEDVDDLLARGKCNFSREEGTVQIIEDVGKIFDGVEELHFVRKDKGEDGGTVLLSWQNRAEYKTFQAVLRDCLDFFTKTTPIVLTR